MSIYLVARFSSRRRFTPRREKKISKLKKILVTTDFNFFAMCMFTGTPSGGTRGFYHFVLRARREGEASPLQPVT